jgi:hypothetical protein
MSPQNFAIFEMGFSILKMLPQNLAIFEMGFSILKMLPQNLAIFKVLASCNRVHSGALEDLGRYHAGVHRVDSHTSPRHL